MHKDLDSTLALEINKQQEDPGQVSLELSGIVNDYLRLEDGNESGTQVPTSEPLVR